MDGRFCMTSPHYPAEYDNNQACTIDIGSNGTITALNFSSEVAFDTLTIGESVYSGTVGPVNVPVRSGTTVRWESDSATTSKGWRLCWASSSSEPLMTQSLEVLSLARNYITGKTDNLEHASGLKTLLLSSNHLSCQSAELESATTLGQGNFGEPSTSTLEEAGKVLGGVTGTASAAPAAKTFKNTVLVFAGNTEESPHHQSMGIRVSLLSAVVNKGRYSTSNQSWSPVTGRCNQERSSKLIFWFATVNL